MFCLWYRHPVSIINGYTEEPPVPWRVTDSEIPWLFFWMAKMETKTRPNNKYDCVNKRLHPSVFYIGFVMASNHSSCKKIKRIMNIVKLRCFEKATKFEKSHTFFLTQNKVGYCFKVLWPSQNTWSLKITKIQSVTLHSSFLQKRNKHIIHTASLRTISISKWKYALSFIDL
mgnify:CR=1 FL=1